ncbi:MAG TPA: QacE family quaternary ammonium compound efflux SMR transporter [Intrasporangiaceae bacterium]|nr:QacE family quaternary ammonium compound efflux SMR transporter [Intrasporangiaceae bacterium]
MAWIILILSGAFEAVWATILGRPANLQRPALLAAFLGSLFISMYGLGWAMRFIPTGTAYVVWVAVGASLTVVYAMLTGVEPVTWIRVLFLLMIISGVIGLKLAS